MIGVIIKFHIDKTEIGYFNAKFGCIFKLARKKKNIYFTPLDLSIPIIKNISNKEKLKEVLTTMIYSGNSVHLIFDSYRNEYKVDYKNMHINFWFAKDHQEISICESENLRTMLFPLIHKRVVFTSEFHPFLFSKIKIKNENDLFNLTFEEFKNTCNVLCNEYNETIKHRNKSIKR